MPRFLHSLLSPHDSNLFFLEHAMTKITFEVLLRCIFFTSASSICTYVQVSSLYVWKLFSSAFVLRCFFLNAGYTHIITEWCKWRKTSTDEVTNVKCLKGKGSGTTSVLTTTKSTRPSSIPRLPKVCLETGRRYWLYLIPNADSKCCQVWMRSSSLLSLQGFFFHRLRALGPERAPPQSAFLPDLGAYF